MRKILESKADNHDLPLASAAKEDHADNLLLKFFVSELASK